MIVRKQTMSERKLFVLSGSLYSRTTVELLEEAGINFVTASIFEAPPEIMQAPALVDGLARYIGLESIRGYASNKEADDE